MFLIFDGVFSSCRCAYTAIWVYYNRFCNKKKVCVCSLHARTENKAKLNKNKSKFNLMVINILFYTSSVYLRAFYF